MITTTRPRSGASSGQVKAWLDDDQGYWELELYYESAIRRAWFTLWWMNPDVDTREMECKHEEHLFISYDEAILIMERADPVSFQIMGEM